MLNLVLSSLLTFGCIGKSSKNKIVDFDSIQTANLKAKPIDVLSEETIHVNYETPVSIKYVPVVEDIIDNIENAIKSNTGMKKQLSRRLLWNVNKKLATYCYDKKEV